MSFFLENNTFSYRLCFYNQGWNQKISLRRELCDFQNVDLCSVLQNLDSFKLSKTYIWIDFTWYSKLYFLPTANSNSSIKNAIENLFSVMEFLGEKPLILFLIVRNIQ